MPKVIELFDQSVSKRQGEYIGLQGCSPKVRSLLVLERNLETS